TRMERFALITNMYLACGGERFLRQRVAEALAVSDTRRPAAGIWELRTSPNERKLSFGWMLRSSAIGSSFQERLSRPCRKSRRTISLLFHGDFPACQQRQT